MKVEIWSDFVCPFCYIGKRRFEAALRRFSRREAVEVAYRSFELDPGAPRDGNPSVYDMLARKYGMSREQAVANTQYVARQAREVGLELDFDRAILTNTFDAHRLAHHAAAKGRLVEMTERLLKAHFTDGLHLGDRETLARLAAEVGLDGDEALRVLESDAYGSDVREDEREAARLGVRGVPFFVIDRRYAVSGAQPSEVFLQALEKAWAEERPSTVSMNETDGEACAGDGCAVPADRQG